MPGKTNLNWTLKSEGRFYLIKNVKVGVILILFCVDKLSSFNFIIISLVMLDWFLEANLKKK